MFLKIKLTKKIMISIQLDELTDMYTCTQLLVFARYVHSDLF